MNRNRRIATVVAALLIVAASSGCFIARTNTIRNMRVMPEPLQLVEGESWCATWGNDGRCQIRVIVLDEIDQRLPSNETVAPNATAQPSE